MKRIRKCCCSCRKGEYKIVGTSPSTSGIWDLTPFQSKNFKTFKGKYWDIWQQFSPEKTIARGRVSRNGKLKGLPNSVALVNGKGNAILRVRCYPVCGDIDYLGEVFATNIGHDGNIWDVSFLVGKRTQRGTNGHFPNRLPIRAFSPRAEIIAYVNIVTDSDGVITQLQQDKVDTGGWYSEIYYPCSGVCVPSPVKNKSCSYVLDYGCMEKLYNTYYGAKGVAPPSSYASFQTMVYSAVFNKWVTDTIYYGTGNSTPSCGGYVKANGALPIAERTQEYFKGIVCCIEITDFDACSNTNMTKQRISADNSAPTVPGPFGKLFLACDGGGFSIDETIYES